MQTDQSLKVPPIPAIGIVTCILGLYAWNVWNNYFICDDAYISFRYAKNLISGHGLVWNVGERVEGYTNFLWVLITALGMTLGVDPEHVSSAISVLAGAGVLLLTIRLGNLIRLPLSFSLVAIATLAVSRSFTAWASSGLETMFFALLILSGNILILTAAQKHSPSRLTLSAIVFSLAILTRPDGAVFAVCAGIFLCAQVARGKLSLRDLCRWCLIAGVTVGAHLVWRHYYYGDLVPNTFYAKVSGAWIEQGLRYLELFNNYYQIVWFLPFIALALLAPARSFVVYLIGQSLLFILYLLYVGGDRFEFRFLVALMPSIYLLVLLGVYNLSLKLASPLFNRLFCAILCIALIYTTIQGSAKTLPKSLRHGIAETTGIASYANRRKSQGLFIRAMIEQGKIPSNLIISVGGAGALPYYSGLTTIDRRGLNDRFIAREKISTRGVIAHEKDAPVSYLRSRQVAVFDVFNQLIFKDLGLLKRNSVEHQGERLPLRAVKLEDRYMVFATPMSDADLQHAFGDTKIIIPSDYAK